MLNLKLNKVEKIFTLVILLSPILFEYRSSIPGIMLGELVLGISAILVMLTTRGKICIKKTKPLLFLWFYGIFISIVSLLFQQSLPVEVLTRIIRFSFYIYMVVLSANHFKVEYGIKTLHLLSVTISVYIILQTIVFKLWGGILPFKVLPFELYRNIKIEEVLRIATTYYYRPMGVFVEPGYAAQFLLPGMLFSLFGSLRKSKPDYISTSLIFIAIILTTSTQGIFLGLIIVFGYLFYSIRSDLKRRKSLRALTLTLSGVIAMIYFLNMDAFERAINKLSWAGVAGSSASVRILRGFAVFFSLPNLYKFIGVGHGNIGNFVFEHQIITKYDPIVMTRLAADYANSVSMTMLYYGFFGFLILVYMYWKFLNRTEKEFRLLVIINIGLLFVAGGVYSYLMIYYFSLIYAGYSKRRKFERTML